LNITGFRDFPLGDLPMLEVCLRSVISKCRLYSLHPFVWCSDMGSSLGTALCL
jgi:hypothetical protein